MVSFSPIDTEREPSVQGIQCHQPQRYEQRTCKYCLTVQWSGEACAQCGAPDDGDRGPLTMAPIGVITI